MVQIALKKYLAFGNPKPTAQRITLKPLYLNFLKNYTHGSIPFCLNLCFSLENAAVLL